MIQHVRSRLRAVVATAICALVAAPALVTGTTTIAAAAPPGVASGALTVNGLGTGLGSNPWHFDGGGYTEVRAALTNANNFGPSGVFKKGTYIVPAAPITTGLSFPGTLSGLDVFFAGLPTSEYSGAEMTALQNFNADGRALVLNSNDIGFGEVSTFLGFTMRTERAFFGNDGVCGWTNSGESAPSPSNAVGSHPIHTGPFGTAPTVSNYHTVQVFTSLPGQAQSLYNLSVTGQTPQFAVTGPVQIVALTGARTNVPAVVAGTIDITAASLNPAGIASVQYYFDSVTPGNEIGGLLNSFPFETSWNTALVPDGVHQIIARVTRTGPAGGGFFDRSLPDGVNVDNIAPDPVDPLVTNTNLDCPGADNGSQVNNNITSASTVAVIPAKSLPGGTNGPIIVTSDLDSMSNAFDTSWAQNRNFTLNAFAWIMDSMIPDVPDDTYFPLDNPARVYDSRQTTPLSHLESRAIQISGVGGVPVDAKTVIANVTVVDPDSSGYFTVFPSDAERPDTSTHNFAAGENFANMITMRLSTAGQISVFDFLDSGDGNVDVLVDIVGVTRRDNGGTRLHTMAPNRLLDTRNGIGLPKAPFGAGQTQTLTVRGGATGVPSDAESVVLNMTVTDATDSASFVTVWPAGLPQPEVSNLNNVVGVARPNLVVAAVGTGAYAGQISIANAFGSAEIIADVVGYFRAGAYKSGGVITGLTPDRILDTRPNDAFIPGQVRSLVVAGAGGIPGTAKTAILKVTAVDPNAAGGFITVWPAGTSNPPEVSNLNFGPGMTIPNLVVTQIGTAGQINIYNALGSTHVLVDVLGYAD